jgi:hypothetical protein
MLTTQPDVILFGQGPAFNFEAGRDIVFVWIYFHQHIQRTERTELQLYISFIYFSGIRTY